MNANIDIELDLENSSKKVLVSVEDLDTILFYSEKYYLNNDGYAGKAFGSTRKDRRRYVFIHHLVMKRKDGFTIDHIDRNPLNCTRRNLRYATSSMQNTNSIKFNPSSKVRGVSFYKANLKYRVSKRINDKVIFFGYFSDKKEAEDFALKLYKENGWQTN